jgi:hypothetical protein
LGLFCNTFIGRKTSERFSIEIKYLSFLYRQESVSH